jgi:hypothetical protein
MSIRQYKLRDINRNPDLHKEIFIVKSDMEKLFQAFIQKAIECGADADKMMENEDE